MNRLDLRHSFAREKSRESRDHLKTMIPLIPIRTECVAIINCTPDSFSDGQIDIDASSVLTKVEKAINNGAKILDIGAESTRPGAAPLQPQEEINRLREILPTIIREAHAAKCQVSLDSYHPETLRWGLDLGVDWINDVTGGRNEEIWRLAKEYSAVYMVMHSLTVPADVNVIISQSPSNVIAAWIVNTFATAEAYGIAPDKLVLDPGLGFGKNRDQNWSIIQSIADLLKLSKERLCVGHSRKSFLGASYRAEEREMETQVVTLYLMMLGTPFIRVHNAEFFQRTLKVARELTTK